MDEPHALSALPATTRIPAAQQLLLAEGLTSVLQRADAHARRGFTLTGNPDGDGYFISDGECRARTAAVATVTTRSGSRAAGHAR